MALFVPFRHFSSRCLTLFMALIFAGLFSSCTTPAAGTASKANVSQIHSQSPAERRAALLRESARGLDSIPVLAMALNDENQMIRRTAVRLLANHGQPATSALTTALSNPDEQVRRTALQALCQIQPADKLTPLLSKALQEEDRVLRLMAVQHLSAAKPISDEHMQLLQLACKDSDPEISSLAQAATWPYFRETPLLRNRPDWDHEVRTLERINLPKEDWAIKIDPGNTGHTLNWFTVDFNDQDWQRIPIEDHWEKAGIDYDGHAWYRKTLTMPAKPAKHNAVQLYFEGVDESAWVWLNGIYIGQHNIGPPGWLVPFALDITEEIKWGTENQLTVRVLDTKGGGGIWKPVLLEILE